MAKKPQLPPINLAAGASANAAAYNSLKNYFNSRSLGAPSLGSDAAQVANYILLNANQNKLGPGTTENSPSIMGRIFDILSRPNYAIANTVKGIQEGHKNNLADFISGLAGTQKTTFSDVLGDAGLSDVGPEGKLRAVLGLGLDIGLDPTTYIGGAGLVGKAKTILGKGAEETVKELPAGAKLLQKGEPVNPADFGLEAAPKVQAPAALKAAPQDLVLPKTIEDLANAAKPASVPEQLALDLPGIPKQSVTIPDSLKKAVEEPLPVGKEVRGQQSFRFRDFNLNKIREATQAANIKRAEDVVAGIANGNIDDALKIVPPPPIKYTAADTKIADQIASRFDPGKATAQLNKQFPNSLNAKQQVRLYYNVRNALNKLGPQSAKATNRVYKATEDAMVKRGFVPRIGTGENVKLSDVLAELKNKKIPVNDSVLKEFSSEISKSSPVGQVIENLRARGAIKDSVKVQNIAETIGGVSKAAENSNLLSDVQMKNVNNILKKLGKSSAIASDASPAAAKATQGIITQAMIEGKPAAQVMLEQKSKLLDDIIAGGKTKRAEVNKVVTLGLERNLGKLPKWVIDENQNKAVEFGMGRIATWWGQKDLRPMTLEALASSAATAQARGTVLANLFKPFNEAQRAEALTLAQGIGKASSPETLQLGTQINRIMTDLTSVLTRSSIDRDFLNKWMRKYGTGFEFAAKKLKHPITGQELDFSKGTDWLQSWKAADVKGDAAQWIFKVQQAIEQATREKSVFDELGERFGSPIAGKGFRNKIDGHPYLKDYYFPDDIAKQIPRMVKDWSSGTKSNHQALQFYDRLLSMWKTNVTIYRPGFHIRNIIGDAYLGLLDGVYSVRPYQLAFRVQRTMTNAYQDLADVDRLVQLGAMSRKYSTPVPGEILFRNKSGVGFTAEQIKAAAHERGLFESFKTLEDIISTGKEGGISLTRPFGGKVQKFAGSLVELQNANGRLAHFIDKVMKSRGNDLPKIFEEASRRARKFHPSGLDLTDFEKKYLRRILPFYSWMRKSTPLLLEGIVMRPGVTVLPAKIGQSIQEAQGIDTPGRDNPFPVDQMFPSWLREQAVGPLSKPDGLLGKFSNQSPAGYVMAGVGLNPLSQLVSQLQHPGQTIGGSLSPVFGIPIELMTGQKLFTGEPIVGPDAQPGALEQYIGEKVPVYSTLQGITGISPFGTQTKAAQRSGGDASKEAIVNWLTGLGIKGTGPYIKSAQYENRQQLLKDFQNKLGG